MSLPWGGLLDINGDWNPPHSTQDNGRVADLGLAGYAAAGGWDMSLILLLRFVVYQNGGSYPVAREGGDLTPGGATLTSPAPHFTSCSSPWATWWEARTEGKVDEEPD
jgi:hypothetical protein